MVLCTRGVAEIGPLCVVMERFVVRREAIISLGELSVEFDDEFGLLRIGESGESEEEKRKKRA